WRPLAAATVRQCHGPDGGRDEYGGSVTSGSEGIGRATARVSTHLVSRRRRSRSGRVRQPALAAPLFAIRVPAPRRQPFRTGNHRVFTGPDPRPSRLPATYAGGCRPRRGRGAAEAGPWWRGRRTDGHPSRG